MAIIDSGILGGFRNKIGKVVGARWRRLDTMRAMPRASNKPPTIKQQSQRSKFALVMGFLIYMAELIDEFYRGTPTSSPMNEAVAYHIKNAVTGVAPNFTLDYTKLVFSKGALKLPSSYSVDTTAAAKIDFNWVLDGADNRYKDDTDVINVMVYNPTKNQFVSMLAAAPRSALTYVLPLPLDFVGDSVYCYFSFSSTKKKNLCSDSVFVVQIPVA